MKIGEYEVLIGADPEVFVTEKNGKLVCAHNMIPGTKEQPHKVTDGAVQVDGMALEFNIDPAKNQAEFIANVDSVYSQLAAMVPNHNLLPESVAMFGKEMMDNTPDEAKELGCDPDFDAWNDGKENPKPDGEVDFRTGAGHIHIGWTQGMDINDASHVEACMMLVRQLDYYLGIPSVVLDPCTKRRELYGKAGAFRVKPYGVEYRVLSNFWLKSKELREWVYSSTILAFTKLLAGDIKELHVSSNNVMGFGSESCAEYTRLFNMPMPKQPTVVSKGLGFYDAQKLAFQQPRRVNNYVQGA